MKKNPFGVARFLTAVILIAAPAVLAVPAAASSSGGPDTWMKVLSTGAEEMNTLEGKTFRAGYLVGSGLIQTKDKNYLAAAYVQGDPTRPFHLALIKFNPSGVILSYTEYGSRRVPFKSGRVPVREHQSYAALAPTADGGAVVAFGPILMKVTRDGKPVWSKDYRVPEKNPPKAQESLLSADFNFKSVSILKNGDIVVCGLDLHHPPNPKPFPDIVVAKVRGEDGVVDWSFEYPELQSAERPALRVLPDGEMVVGSEPKAVVRLHADGKLNWARSLAALPFKRGIKERPDVGSLLHYQTIGALPGGDVVFSGIYNLSFTTYKALGALLCRISSDGNSILWAERVHSPAHGGETFVRDIVPAGDSFYAVGLSTEYGADEGDWNHNALVLQLGGGGGLNWVRSIGKKRKSEAQSEYREEQANGAAVAPDGGVIVAGAADSFAHPDPGFHTVINWTTRNQDLLLARLSASGGIANLPIGRWPKLLSAPDAGDTKIVEVLPVPIALNKLDVNPQKLMMAGEDARYGLKEENLQTQFDTTSAGAEGQTPVADFKILPSPREGDRLLHLDGTLSTAPAGRGIVLYRWTLGDRTPPVTAAVAKPAFNYGTFSYTQDVTLVVEDALGYESKPCVKKVVTGSIVRDKGIPPGLCSGKDVNYKIEILTGDMPYAGTDALVFVSLYGKPDDKGQRQLSGEAFLGEKIGTTSTNPFERGQLDTFDLSTIGSEMKWDVDNVDYLSLRHDNRNKDAEWYARGVKVTNLTTKKEWLFVPDQWLDDARGPDHKTYGEFKPEPSYPKGIFIGGEIMSAGMTEASGNIFILPKDTDEFYFTSLTRDSTLIMRSAAGVNIGASSTGSSQMVLPFLKKTEWGTSYKTSNITIPTRFAASISQGGSERVKSIWVFPSNWAGYETEARRVALLYPMGGRTSVLDCGTKYQAFMVASGKDATKIPDMSPIIDYGLAAFGIFGDIPDEKLKWYLEYNTEQYSKYKLDKAMNVAATYTNDPAFKSMVSQYFDMLDLLVKARNWAERLPQVIAFSTDSIYGGDLVGDLGTNDANLKQAAEIMHAVKDQMDALMASIRGDPTKSIAGNDPAKCRTTLNRIRMLCVGPNPSSENSADHKIRPADLGLSPETQYPLTVLFGGALKQIADWTKDGAEHPLFSNAYYSSIRRTGALNFDAHGATLYAMTVYEPAIRTMMQVASPIIDASLTVDDKNPLWIR